MHDQIHVSGISVLTRPRQLDAAVAAIRGLPGTEIHAKDHASGRLVVVQDLPTVVDHQNGLRRIQALPQVLVAELVYLYGEEATRNVTGELAERSEQG